MSAIEQKQQLGRRSGNENTELLRRVVTTRGSERAALMKNNKPGTFR